MGKRIVSASLIAALLVLLTSIAASAAPGGHSSDASGQAKRGGGSHVNSTHGRGNHDRKTGGSAAHGTPAPVNKAAQLVGPRTSLMQRPVDAATHPPGNNGFVKIKNLPFEAFPPSNQPHVGCRFAIAFYNYDRGDLWADYTLALHPPTRGGTLLEGKVFIGGDPAGGGKDLDAVVTIDLTKPLAASGASPHPKQGYHVFLTVRADGSIGADVKHKVFWVKCSPAEEELVTPPTPAGTALPHRRITKTVVESLTLPSTGFDLMEFSYAGCGLISVGHALRRRRRKRTGRQTRSR